MELWLSSSMIICFFGLILACIPEAWPKNYLKQGHRLKGGDNE